MERVNAVLKHPEFCNRLRKIAELERDRVFCGHGLEHMLDVARIAYIQSLEIGNREFKWGIKGASNPGVIKELIYAAALLHDIGRARQYEDGTPHEQESARIAAKILPECRFDENETSLILDAILSHRAKSDGEIEGFAGLMCRADMLSRRCYDCAVSKDCKWETKNTLLEY